MPLFTIALFYHTNFLTTAFFTVPSFHHSTIFPVPIFFYTFNPILPTESTACMSFVPACRREATPASSQTSFFFSFVCFAVCAHLFKYVFARVCVCVRACERVCVCEWGERLRVRVCACLHGLRVPGKEKERKIKETSCWGGKILWETRN